MSNMSYCRFENTYRDLNDCYNNINGKLSNSEHEYRKRMVELCQSIIDEYDEDLDEDVLNDVLLICEEWEAQNIQTEKRISD